MKNINEIVGLTAIVKFLDGGTAEEKDNRVIYRSVSAAAGGQTRYLFDEELCRAADGWKQYDTEQDASYFGVWVHVEGRLIVTFAEGDVSVVYCLTDEALKDELHKVGDFYGATPLAFKVYAEAGKGNALGCCDERPTVMDK